MARPALNHRLLALTALLPLLAVACSGCVQPLQVGVGVRLVPELASPGNSGPVQPMPVPDVDPQAKGPAIAVVDVDGLMLNYDFTGVASSGENPVALFRERLNWCACHQDVRGIVIRINSPGGGVTASDMMWHELQRFKERTCIPVTACLMDLGAGGAYYLATGADQIVAHPTSVVGGIGVILNTYNLQDALQQFNIAAVPIRSGDKIDIGSPVKAMDASQKKILQDMADEFHHRFEDVVHQGRPEVDMDDKAIFDGRVFTAKQAEERRLVDFVGYLDDAVAMTRRMAGCPHARLIMFHRQNDVPHSMYSITPNVPLTAGLVPLSLPGFDRSRLPGFLYMWQPEPTMERLSGK